MSTNQPVGRIPAVRCGAVWLLAALVVIGAGAASAVTVEQSARDAVVFSLELPAPTWRPGVSSAADEPAWDAQLPGFAATATPGQVRLPRRGLSLVVPPGTRPRLEVVRESWRDLDGRRLAVETVPVMVEDPETGRAFERPFVLTPDAELPVDRVPAAVLADLRDPDVVPLAGPAVRLGEVSWWRGRRVVNLQVIPVRADAEGRAARALATGRWRVRFVPDDARAKAMPTTALKRLTGKGDARFAAGFLNGELLATLPTEAAYRGVTAGAKARAAAAGTPLGYPDVRLPVNRTQLHRVRAERLVETGLIPAGATIQEGQLRLYQRRYVADLDDPADDTARPYVEVEVPIHVVGEGDVFDGDDLFLFWGLRPADDEPFTHEVGGETYELEGSGDQMELYNEHNVYYLQYADPDPGEAWARMDAISLPPSSGAPLESYQRTDRIEEAVSYRERVPAITVDRYYLSSYRTLEPSIPFTLWSPVEGQDDATIRVSYANFSPLERTILMWLERDDEVVAELESFTLPDTFYERIYTETLPESVMETGTLTLKARNSIATLPFIYAYIDWLRLDYRARYSAPFGRLAFPGGDAEVAVGNLEIDGFPDDELGLVEVTDPRAPRFVALTDDNLVPAGDQLTLSIQVDQTAGQRRFYAATRMLSNGVSDVDYDEAEAVANTTPPTQLAGSRADVLVVTHPEFAEQVDEWAEYRRSRDPDLTIHVVEPQQVYDWYSGGVRNPWAIKRLVNHALESPTWGTWALVFFGDANENPREIGVMSSGRQWSRDWVPTHFHVQDIGQGLAPEVLASDEWYGFPAAGDEITFPTGNNITDVPALYIGRIPCNSQEELARVIEKIRQVETDDGQAWRRRGIFISDDAWSSGTLGAEGFTLRFRESETAFEESENGVLAQRWLNNAGMVSLTPDTVMLRTFMEPYYPPEGEVSWRVAKENCEESNATEALAAALSNGGTLAHYQGHANHWLLAHEWWFVDDRRYNDRVDIDLVTNVGKPWLFCGMGCHLGDFIQNVAGPASSTDPGLGEKFLLWLDGGAVASYGSSGYEFLNSNRTLSEIFIQQMMIEPPRVAADGQEISTRWLLGELIWSSERAMLASTQNSYIRAMVYQYTILGDPLVMLDAGPPEVDATLVGTGPLEGETQLVAVDATNRRVVELQARDEAGIDRLLVRDSAGNDLTAAVVEATPYYDDGRRQIMDYVITLPVRPFAHDLTIDVYDAADRLDTDHHVSYTLGVAHEYEAVFAADGQVVDPATYVFTVDEPVDFTVSVTSAAWLDEETEIEGEGQNLEITGFSARVLDRDHLEVSFTATATGAKADRGLRLLVDGYETYVALETSDVPGANAGITGLVNFPNPMREATRFLFETNLHGGAGKVRVWTVSGRTVADVPFTLAGGGREVVPWDGRDREGDRLANGTYLYRVELAGPAGRVRSDMQRLVIMR